jgi:hypothetical protein
MQIKYKLSSDGGDSGSKKYKWVNSGVWRSRHGSTGKEKIMAANVRHASRVCRSCYAEKKKLSTDGGDRGRNKCKWNYGGAYGGVWRRLPLARAWIQAVPSVLVRLAGIWL